MEVTTLRHLTPPQDIWRSHPTLTTSSTANSQRSPLLLMTLPQVTETRFFSTILFKPYLPFGGWFVVRVLGVDPLTTWEATATLGTSVGKRPGARLLPLCPLHDLTWSALPVVGSSAPPGSPPGNWWSLIGGSGGRDPSSRVTCWTPVRKTGWSLEQSNPEASK